MDTRRVTCQHIWIHDTSTIVYGVSERYCSRCGITYVEWAETHIRELEDEIKKLKNKPTKRTENVKGTPTNDDTPADLRARTLRIRYIHPHAEAALLAAGALIELIGDSQRVLLPHDAQFRGRGLIQLPTHTVLVLIPDSSREFDGKMLSLHPQQTQFAQIRAKKLREKEPVR